MTQIEMRAPSAYKTELFIEGRVSYTCFARGRVQQLYTMTARCQPESPPGDRAVFHVRCCDHHHRTAAQALACWEARERAVGCGGDAITQLKALDDISGVKRLVAQLREEAREANLARYA